MASAAERPMLPEDLLRSLECPICTDLYNNPKLLKCHHIFCENCIQEYVDRTRETTPSCPVCRTPITCVGPGKPASLLPTQSFYQDLIERYSKNDTGDIKTDCSVCKNQAVLDSKCETCEMLMCVSCTSNHATFPSMKDHAVIKLDECFDSNSSETCSAHPTSALTIFCRECQLAICKVCLQSGHTQHKIESLSKVAKEAKNDLHCVLVEIDSYIAEVDGALKDVRTVTHDYQTRHNKIRNSVKLQFENIMTILEQKQSAILQELQDVEDRIAREQENADAKRACAEAIRGFASTLNDYGCSSDILKTRDQILDDWKNILKQPVRRLGDFEYEVTYTPPDGRVLQTLEQNIAETSFGTLKQKQRIICSSFLDTGIEGGTITHMRSRNGIVALTYQKLESDDGHPQSSVTCSSGVKVYTDAGKQLYEGGESRVSRATRQLPHPLPVHNGIALTSDADPVICFRHTGVVEYRTQKGQPVRQWSSNELKDSVFTINDNDDIVSLDCKTNVVTIYSLDGIPSMSFPVSTNGRLLKMSASANEIVLLYSEGGNVKCVTTSTADGSLTAVRELPAVNDAFLSMDAKNFIGKQSNGLMVLTPLTGSSDRQERIHIVNIVMDQIRDLGTCSLAEDGVVATVLTQHPAPGRQQYAVLFLRYLP